MGEPEFTIVTQETFEAVSKELEGERGSIIIVEPEYWTYPKENLTGKFWIHFLDRPQMKVAEKRLAFMVPRENKVVNGDFVQTGWEHDRAYLLRERASEAERKKALKEGKMTAQAREFFEYFNVDDQERFELKIDFQDAPYRSYPYENQGYRAIYVPRAAGPRAGLTEAFAWATRLWNNKPVHPGFRPDPFSFTDAHVQRIVDYVTEDLETGKVLRHNVRAAQEADAFCGYGE